MRKNILKWIAFSRIFAGELTSIWRIWNHIENIDDLFRLPDDRICGWGVDKKCLKELRSRKNFKNAEKELDSLQTNDYFILTIEDSDYPRYLREIHAPPCVLYGAGQRDALSRHSISIVGSREPSPYGRVVAKKLACDLAERGAVIVSGMARGIDSLAHRGALERGRTVAVLGSGLGNIYPRENMKLFNKIIEKGAVITEFPFGALPLGYHFPLRNRIISGLSLALVVIEAARKSGSLISARLALEQNREVMAVPGNVTSANSWGCNWLIQNGAKLVSEWKDVAEELPPEVKEMMMASCEKTVPSRNGASLNPEEQALLEALTLDSLTHIDELAFKTDIHTPQLLSLLLNLELRGMVSQYPGKYFQRTA